MKQTQTLSPQMMQSMEILQMGSQELLEYIQDQVQENPVLEMEEKYGKGDDTAVLQRKLEWLESTDAQNRYYHQQDTEDDEKDPISNYGTVDEREENLYLYVLSQLEVMDLEPELLPVGRFLVEEPEPERLAGRERGGSGGGAGQAGGGGREGLAAVQSLEPRAWGPGICRSAWCCNCSAAHEDSELAIRIARDYLDPLSKSLLRSHCQEPWGLPGGGADGPAI